MTKKQDQVTKAGAVALEESQLEDVQGGVIAIAPIAHKESQTIKFGGSTVSLEDQAAQKVRGDFVVKL